jgi:hypothetical protein
MLWKTIAAACLAVTFAAHAAQTQPAQKAAAAPAKGSQDEVICTSERATGSHIAKRTCSTRAQRDAQAKADQDAMRNMHGPAKANTSTSR